MDRDGRGSEDSRRLPENGVPTCTRGPAANRSTRPSDLDQLKGTGRVLGVLQGAPAPMTLIGPQPRRGVDRHPVRFWPEPKTNLKLQHEKSERDDTRPLRRPFDEQPFSTEAKCRPDDLTRRSRHRTRSQRSTPRAFPWSQVDDIVSRFGALNPYDRDVVSGSIREYGVPRRQPRPTTVGDTTVTRVAWDEHDSRGRRAARPSHRCALGTGKVVSAHGPVVPHVADRQS